MFQMINSNEVMLVEDMQKKYLDCLFLYETARDDSGYSKGKVLAISDFENVVKLKELEGEFIQNGKEVALGNSFGGTFASVKCEVY